MARSYTLWIIGICIVVFIVQILLPGFTESLLLDQSKPFEVWRFATSMFIHADITHILFNMLALFMFGLALEKFIGGKRFLLVFFGAGIIANLIAVNFYPTSLGASGAIFGVIGALIIIRPTLTVFAFGIPMPLFIAGMVWAFVDIAGIFTPSNVANIAHLSGLGLGIILGAIFRDWNQKRTIQTKVTLDENYMRNWEDKYM